MTIQYVRYWLTPGSLFQHLSVLELLTKKERLSQWVGFQNTTCWLSTVCKLAGTVCKLAGTGCYYLNVCPKHRSDREHSRTQSRWQGKKLQATVQGPSASCFCSVWQHTQKHTGDTVPTGSQGSGTLCPSKGLFPLFLAIETVWRQERYLIN